MLTGQNGILNRVAEAKEKTAAAQKEENERLNDYEKSIDKYTSNLPSTEETMPYLPDATKFEKVLGTDLKSGLVIREKVTGSEYVWVEVPRTIVVYQIAGINIKNFTDKEYDKIEKDLYTYTRDYRNGTSYSDTYAKDETTGWFANEEQYNELKNKMLKSIYENGGFWVGRYEAGSSVIRTKLMEERQVPIIKDNVYPYNYITRTQAKVLSEQVESGSSTSSLIYGLQWGLMLKYIESKNVASKDVFNKDSTAIGNYKDSSWTTEDNVVKYSKDSSISFLEGTYSKSKGESCLVSSGASKSFSLMNIYDIAGNMWEWSLEYSGQAEHPGTQIGGSCYAHK